LLALQVATATLPFPTRHARQLPTRAMGCNTRTRRLATHRLAIVVSVGVGVCQSSTADYIRVQTTVDDRTAGWCTIHLSNIRVTLGFALCPYSLCPNVACVDRPQSLSCLLETDDHAYRRSAMVSSSGVPPSPESSVVSHAASHYSAFQASHHTRYPTAPSLHGVQTDTTHRMSLTVRSGRVHGRALLGFSRLAVFNRLQPL